MFNIIFTIVPILVVCIFIFTFAMILSPKLRGKMMSKQMKSLKYMMEDSEEILTDLSKSAINVQKNILDENEDTLKDIATKKANISKKGIETTVRAIKKGLDKEVIYCKHCGSSIDSDSKFCKNCGKEQ